MVRVRTWIEENRSRRVTFAYEVLNGKDDSVLVTGFTRHVWTDAQGRVTRVPDSWKQVFSD
jgi:acyl-CoA thioesterase FadM